MNQGYSYRERLGGAARGQTVIGYLSARYPHATEQEWRRRIVRGLVLLDGSRIEAERELAPGAILVWNRPPWTEPEAPTSYVVLFEDDDVLAVAKPAGLPCMPGASYLERTLLHQVRRRTPRATPLHRLGRGTSGVVLFALHRDAHRSLSEAWARREVERLYRAVVRGSFPCGETVLEYPIGKVPHEILGQVFAVSPAGKRSVTRAVFLEHREGGSSLVEIRIETGRTHQIRIHLAAAGHPLVGDPLYREGGVPAARHPALPGDTGYFLHAYRLSFLHPRTRSPIVVVCGPPPFYRAASESPAPPSR
jgi:23S rRNA pseudouridine1911/1915/1917 synthase